MRVAIAQIAPVLLDRDRTTAKIIHAIADAASNNASIVCFGEALLPGYPVWLSPAGGASFNDPDHKELHRRYLDQAVNIQQGHLQTIRDACNAHSIWTVLGIAERPTDRAGHTIYCSAVIINDSGQILGVHRKLMPTYEERLAWGMGDAAGLVTHRLQDFTLGALNCWENWLPLARAALHAQSEDLHVALWPGCRRLTEDITRFAALEGRSYVISACALIREGDLPKSLPLRDQIARPGQILYDGGSCIASPDGSWLVQPAPPDERLILADLDPGLIGQERQNLDISGHYARPDILRLVVDARRQAALERQT